MCFQFLRMRLSFAFTITCLFFLHQLTIATLPGVSSDFLLPRSGPGRLRETDMNSLSSSVAFHPSLITCTYHGIWGCPIWRVRVSFPPPDLSFDSVAGSTLDLPVGPLGSDDPNDTSSHPLRRAATTPESSSLSTPTSRFQALLRETCGSGPDGDANASDFQTEGRVDGSVRVEFRLAYARILEDTVQPARGCVEDALERMFGGGQGMRIQCRIPGVWRDNGPPQHDWT